MKIIKGLGAQYTPSIAFELVDREMEEETDKSMGKQPCSKAKCQIFTKIMHF